MGTTNHAMGTTHHSIETTNHSMGTTNHAMGTTHHSIETTNHSMGTTNHAMGTTHHSIETTNHSVGTTHYYVYNVYIFITVTCVPVVVLYKTEEYYNHSLVSGRNKLHPAPPWVYLSHVFTEKLFICGKKY